METKGIEKRIVNVLLTIAPDVSESDLDPLVDIQEQFELDSVDVINFIARLQEEFGLEIPNKDYRRFLTIAEGANYIREKGYEKRSEVNPPN